MDWIPRDQNNCADFLSKIVDVEDLGISDTIFQEMNDLWGPYDMDWFASWYNAKCSRFYSRYWNPGSVGIDAFTCDWGGINGWFVPPVYLITRVLKHMALSRGYGTLSFRTGSLVVFGHLFLLMENTLLRK